MAEPFPTWRRWLYACGSAGFQITDRMVVMLLLYFYLPPPESGLVPQLSDTVFALGLTSFGAAMLLGRVFDMLADPVVGYGSDRSRSHFGRRRVYLLVGWLPMCLLPLAAFWPPGPPGGSANAVWLTSVLSLYFVFFTIYVGPYLALQPELARTTDDRVALARQMAIVAVPVVFVVNTWGAGFEALQARGWSPADAMRAVMVLLALLACFLCWLPIAAIDEKRFAHSGPAQLSFWRAVGETLGNRPFRHYLEAQLLFILGVNMLLPALPYIARVLLGREESFLIPLTGVLGVGLVVGFWSLPRSTERLGPKRAMVACVAVFSLCLFGLGGLSAVRPGEPGDTQNLVLAFGTLALLGAPAAGFFVLPSVLIALLVDADERRTGAPRSAMFFGIQGLVTKVMFGVSTALLAYLFQRFGNSADAPLGVQLVGPVAGTACGLSALLYMRVRMPEPAARPGADAS
ncbi:MAG: MFS transporter [Proteobacteria bacterium]|nr:MFS transporter [Pseudomonadota bacterium]